MQLDQKWYVRDARWKLNDQGELFDMKDSPFQESLVRADSTDPQAQAARAKLQAAFDSLRPQDVGIPAGAEQNKRKKEVGKKKKQK